MKSTNSYIVQLDGLRFFAIFMVMIAHWAQWQFNHPVINGFPFTHGVTLFFVLSGFLITDILLKNKIKYEDSYQPKKYLLKSFYIRRFLRIFPIYYLTIFLLYFIKYQNTQDIFPWLVTYTSNIYQSIHNIGVGDFNHFWSLAVEEQFYLIWPWLMIFTPNKHIAKVIIFTIILSIASKLYITIYVQKWMANSYFTLSCMNSLGLGALLAYWAIYKKNILDFFLKSYWVLGSIVLYFAIHYFSLFKQWDWYIVILDEFIFSIMAAIIINYASKNKFKHIFKYILENKFIVYCGKISYGLYVYHLFIPALFWFIAPYIGLNVTNKYTLFVFYFGLTFVIAHLSWKIIESPINSLKRKFPYFGKEE